MKDISGNMLHTGDWVRVVALPHDVKKYPRSSRRAFQLALGKTFRIESFNDIGWAELPVGTKLDKQLKSFGNVIWIEAEYLKLFRKKSRKC